MKQKILFVATLVIAAVLASFTFISSKSNHHEFTVLELANIESLTNNENDEAKYQIYPYDCTISGVGKIQLGDGRIISLSGNGTFTISGARDCAESDTERFLCSPIECTDLYEVIF